MRVPLAASHTLIVMSWEGRRTEGGSSAGWQDCDIWPAVTHATEAVGSERNEKDGDAEDEGLST